MAVQKLKRLLADPVESIFLQVPRALAASVVALVLDFAVLELCVRVIGMPAVPSAIIGYLVYEAIARPPEARPEIAVRSEAPIRLEDGRFLVPIEVKNAGHVTGAGVNVSGALVRADGAVIEESAVTFDFIAQHSRVSGGLYFAADPAANRLVLRVEGYTDP